MEAIPHHRHAGNRRPLAPDWDDWRSALTIVKPETVVAWHRADFCLFWTWKVRRGHPGRPLISREVRALIRQMCRENPGWGAPRIHGELLKLGIDIGRRREEIFRLLRIRAERVTSSGTTSIDCRASLCRLESLILEQAQDKLTLFAGAADGATSKP